MDLELTEKGREGYRNGRISFSQGGKSDSQPVSIRVLTMEKCHTPLLSIKIIQTQQIGLGRAVDWVSTLFGQPYIVNLYLFL